MRFTRPKTSQKMLRAKSEMIVALARESGNKVEGKCQQQESWHKKKKEQWENHSKCSLHFT